MIEEFLVRFTSPEIHVGDFKVTPNWNAKGQAGFRTRKLKPTMA